MTTHKSTDLRSRLVVGQKRDGRREYDEEARLELIRLCLKPGVSIARTAMEHDINPNLLRTWIARYREGHAARSETAPAAGQPEREAVDVFAQVVHARQSESAVVPSTPAAVVPAFVPVVPMEASPPALSLRLHVRLPNGVEFDLGEARLEELSSVVQMLGRLPCSASTKG